jgi:hypothetical protein
MVESTGQLDKLIEEKVNQEIEAFARNITTQVVEFLEKNGNSASHFYQASKWDSSYNGYNRVTDTSLESTVFFKTKLVAGLSRSLKDKMISAATQDLLNKIKLLS